MFRLTFVCLPVMLCAQVLPPAANGVTMGHIHLNVHDVAAQKNFWVTQFDAVPVRVGNSEGVKLPNMLILFRQQDPSGDSEGTVADHFGLRTRNLADALQRARAAGVPVLRVFTGSEGFPNAYLEGPDHLRVELREDKTIKPVADSHHIHYYMAEPLALQAWYVKTLGMQATRRGPYDTVDVPGMNLTFRHMEQIPTASMKGRLIDHIGFEVKNLQAFAKTLAAKGIKMEIHKDPEMGIPAGFLEDPLGVRIELTEGLVRF
jgi:catechol 2,3-dioxygenase-like lactoylglutathione lyase family enzyme